MTRVRVIVEGQTEEAFVNQILAPALFASGVYLTPTLIGRPGHRGGQVTFERICRDLVLSLKQDRESYCTTLVDYYGIGKGFVDVSYLPTVYEKVETLELSVLSHVREAVPETRAVLRCLPYIQLHEFEGLLFSDVGRLSEAVDSPSILTRLQAIRCQFNTPEEINDSKETAPSKRLSRLVPGYNKVLHGSLAAGRVGIEAMVRECPRFRRWVERLAALEQIA